jgi:hypothetical protein
VSGGSLFAERSTFQGGDGSFCFPSPFFTYEGAGGPGIHLASSVPVVHLFGGSAVGGQHGCHQSSAAPIVISSGSVVQIPGSPRAFQIPSPLREGQVAALAFTGLAGDLAFLGLSFVPAHFPVFDVLSGVLHLGAPIDVLPMGVVPPSGSLAFPILVPELGPGVEAFLWRIQAGFLSADFASAVLADPAAPVLIDVGL